jgi:Lrp/AsnC family leucine-responsive transcriptional regulator
LLYSFVLGFNGKQFLEGEASYSSKVLYAAKTVQDTDFLRGNMETTSKYEKLMDQIGWKLLHELQLNGRLSYAELGRRVGLTTPAVVERVKRMEEAGIIVGYHADVDPMKIGMPITAFIRMSVVGDVFTKITAVVKNSPEVVECHRGTGADSFIMKVHVRSVEHLEGLIDRLTPYGTTSTSIVLSSPVEQREIRRPEEIAQALAQHAMNRIASK